MYLVNSVRSLALPEQGFPKEFPTLPKEDYKRQLYDKLLQWWQQNKDKTVFEEEPGKLAVKGK